MHKSTCFKNMSWAVVWDEQLEEQVYHQDIDIVIAGDAISFVGNAYDGKADVTVDGRGWLILPGLINLHSHPATEPAQRGNPRGARGTRHVYEQSLRAECGLPAG